MRIFALNKAGVRIDKDTGERKATPKGLKQTSINLQWFELLEYELPPICEKDVELYYDNLLYKGLPADKVNKLVGKWDRYILDEYIPPMMHYNKMMCLLYVRLFVLIRKKLGLDILLVAYIKLTFLTVVVVIWLINCLRNSIQNEAVYHLKNGKVKRLKELL